MLNKINVLSIVRGHLATLHRIDSDSNPRLEKLLYFLWPLLMSFLLVFWPLQIKIDKDIASIAISALSIFGGLLFALPITFYSLSDKFKIELKELSEDDERNFSDDIKNCKKVLALISETYYNVSFAILLCIVSIISTSFCCFFKDTDMPLTNQIFSGISFFFYVLLFITVFMVIKRMHSLFTFSLKNTEY